MPLQVPVNDEPAEAPKPYFTGGKALRRSSPLIGSARERAPTWLCAKALEGDPYAWYCCTRMHCSACLFWEWFHEEG